MKKSQETQEVRNGSGIFEAEKRKLTGLFAAVDPSKRALVEGLIEDAAFIYAANRELRAEIDRQGAILRHPKSPSMTKPNPMLNQYNHNIGMYAVAIKALNSVLSKDMVEADDEFDRFIKEHQANEKG